MNDILAMRINAVLNDMSGLTDSEISALKNSLWLRFGNLNISEKSTELQKYDDTNIKTLKSFLAVKRIEGLSDKTLMVYKYVMRNAFDYIAKNIKDITKNDIRIYLAYLNAERHLSDTSINNYYRYLSTFFGWAYGEEIIGRNPMVSIKPIKTAKVVKKPFSATELASLTDTCKSLRDRALIEFLLSTGCRVSEAVSVDVSDIDMQNYEVIVRGKGNKERTVYISEQAMYHLKRYLTSRDDDCAALFISKYKCRLTKQSAELSMRLLGEKAGISDCTPHRFRRTCATTLLRRGMPIEQVQRILGHEKIETTLIYAQIDQSAVKAKHMALVG